MENPNVWAVVFVRYNSDPPEWRPEIHEDDSIFAGYNSETSYTGTYPTYEEALESVITELSWQFKGESPGCFFFDHPDYIQFKEGKLSTVVFDNTEKNKNEYMEYHDITLSKSEIVENKHTKLYLHISRGKKRWDGWDGWEWNIFRIPTKFDKSE